MRIHCPGGKLQCKRWLIGVLLILAVTLSLLALPLGGSLTKFSYDLPFLFRGNIADTDVVVLVEDRATLDALGHATFPPARTVHAQLVDKLREEGAQLVVFDISFRAAKPGEDEPFAEAIRRHGHVILGGVVETTMRQLGDSAGASVVEIKPPTDLLRAAAAGWGLLVLGDLDSNLGVRKIITQWKDNPAVPWLAAQYTGVISESDDPKDGRWINFYGPSPALDQVTLGEVLGVGGRKMPVDFLRGKVVFVGFDSAVTPASGRRDVFATPFTRAGKEFTPGVEILANVYANLANQDWLRRMPLPIQCLLALVFGAVTLVVLVFAGRRWMWLVAALVCLLLVVFSVMLQWYFHWWWNWLALALVQLPLTVVLALLYPHLPMVAFISYRRKGGSDFAVQIHQGLLARGYDTFLDVKDISKGEWLPQIETGIDRTPNFILILSPSMFEEQNVDQTDWVYEEIQRALTAKKNIIPIMLDGFVFPSTLPSGMERLPKIQSIVHNHAHFESTFDELQNKYLKR